MKSNVRAIKFDHLWARLPQRPGTKPPEERLTTQLSRMKKSLARELVDDFYVEQVSWMKQGLFRELPSKTIQRSQSTYNRQVELATKQDLDGQPLLNRRWFLGRLGPDHRMLAHFLSGPGTSVAVGFNPNELILLDRDARPDLRKKFGSVYPPIPIQRSLSLDETYGQSKIRLMQPYMLKTGNGDFRKATPDSKLVIPFRWHNGFSFIPIDPIDIETLGHFVYEFQSNRKFDGLVLKYNHERFEHHMFERRRSRDGETLVMPPQDLLTKPRKLEWIRQAYETWLEATLVKLCAENLAILVSGEDAPFVLPYLLAHDFHVLYPNRTVPSSHCLPLSHRIVIAEGYHDAHFGDLKLRGTSHFTVPGELVDGSSEVKEGMMGISACLNGNFLILEGNAGAQLSPEGRELTAAEQELVGHYNALFQQQLVLQKLAEQHPEARPMAEWLRHE